MDDEISDIRNPCEGVGKNKNRIALADGIRQQQERTGEAQPPERLRHDDPLVLFRRVPLDDKTREENQVPQPADDFPDAPINAQKFSIVPDQVGQPVHNSRRLTHRRMELETISFLPISNSPARDNFHDLQFVSRIQLTPRKFRRRDSLAVVLHDYAARQ